MRWASITLFAVALITAGAANAAAPEPVCDLVDIPDERAAMEALSRRAVEIIVLAGRPTWKTNSRLAALVSPSATFSLGAVDVGIELSNGVAGARAMAVQLKAGTARFNGLDYMAKPMKAAAT